MKKWHLIAEYQYFKASLVICHFRFRPKFEANCLVFMGRILRDRKCSKLEKWSPPTPYALCYRTMNMLAVIVKMGCSETVFASL